MVFAPDGKFITSFTASEKSPGAFRDGTAIAIDDAGRLFVYDERAERIQVYQ